MRILIVDVYYPAFLERLYAERPELAGLNYDAQWRALMDTGFGTADYYSKNLMQLGHEAHEVIFNAAPLQRQWVRERGLKLREKEWDPLHRRWHGIPLALRKSRPRWPYEVLAEQIKDYRPDVLHVQDINSVGDDFVREVRGSVGYVVGQTAYALKAGENYGAFDLILTSLPHYVDKFRGMGLQSELFRLAFEPDILQKLKKEEGRHEATHIGGYRAVHRERNEILEHLIDRGIDLECWGYGLNELPVNSAIRKKYRGEAWGLAMHGIRHNSSVVVSRHVSSVASVHANIMTLYEATGVGSVLAIDMRKDLAALFDPDREVLAYSSAEECFEKIRFMLDHDRDRETMAAAGQARTLREHTYLHRMRELVEIIKSRRGMG